jgi:hypothetical protein
LERKVDDEGHIVGNFLNDNSKDRRFLHFLGMKKEDRTISL